MQDLRAVCSVAMTLLCAVAAVLAPLANAEAAWDKPWTTESRALVIDAYEFNPIDWQSLASDKRIAGFINKASDGMPPEWNCKGKSGDQELLCKNRWWKYSVTKELYMTRKAMAKALGLKWGAYHLARPGNPREQADHFIDFAEPEADDLIAIDIEDNTEEWMSLSDAEIFANQIFIRTGRYPVLYTNGSTAKWISDYKATYPLLSRLPLWYARYRDDITGMFPETTWPSYALWQFSSMHNCSAKKCPYRVKGAKTDIDVNVSPFDVAGLKAAWPFDELVTPLETPASPAPAFPSLVAELRDTAGEAMVAVGKGVARLAEAGTIATGAPTTAEIAAARAAEPVLAAYGPSGEKPKRVDPLALISEIARAEHAAAAEPVKAAVPPLATPVAALAPVSDVPAGARKMLRASAAPVRVASLGDLSSMNRVMREVAAIVPKPEKARLDPAASSPVKLDRQARSKVREWLAAAEARQAEMERSMSETILSKAASEKAVRGARPAAAALRRLSVFGPPAPATRIAEAFRATH